MVRKTINMKELLYQKKRERGKEWRISETCKQTSEEL
jgi:hypothetical protein